MNNDDQEIKWNEKKENNLDLETVLDWNMKITEKNSYLLPSISVWLH